MGHFKSFSIAWEERKIEEIKKRKFLENNQRRFRNVSWLTPSWIFKRLFIWALMFLKKILNNKVDLEFLD
jgi:hypothetical protein